MEENLKCRKLSERQIQELFSVLQNCRDVLGDLNAMKQKYEALGSKTAGLSAKIQKGSKKLNWDQNEAKDLRSRMISTIQVLTAFNLNLER